MTSCGGMTDLAPLDACGQLTQLDLTQARLSSVAPLSACGALISMRVCYGLLPGLEPAVAQQ